MTHEGKHALPGYFSGQDYILEFRSFRYGFNRLDLEQRAEQAAVQLELVTPGTLGAEERADLIRLVVSGTLDHPLSPLGDYLVAAGDSVLLHRGQSLVYWLRELICRGAWLDMQILAGQIEVVFDEERMDFAYFAAGHPAREIGLPPHPSWHAVRFS